MAIFNWSPCTLLESQIYPFLIKKKCETKRLRTSYETNKNFDKFETWQTCNCGIWMLWKYFFLFSSIYDDSMGQFKKISKKKIKKNKKANNERLGNFTCYMAFHINPSRMKIICVAPHPSTVWCIPNGAVFALISSWIALIWHTRHFRTNYVRILIS